MNKKIVEAVLTVVTAYTVYRLSPEGRNAIPLETVLLRIMAVSCQRIAFAVGSLGLRAEASYQERIKV